MSNKSGELIGVGRFKIREGMYEEYRRLALQCIETARNKDTGTLQYEIYFNDEQTEVMFIERYKDSASLIEHFRNLGDLVEAIIATVHVIHGELLGDPDPELRKMLESSEYPHLFTNLIML